MQKIEKLLQKRAAELLAEGTVERVLAWQAGEFFYDNTPAAVSSVDNNLVSIHAHADNTLSSGSLNLVDIQHTAAGSADGVNKLTLNAVALQQLVYSVCITRL